MRVGVEQGNVAIWLDHSNRNVKLLDTCVCVLCVLYNLRGGGGVGGVCQIINESPVIFVKGMDMDSLAIGSALAAPTIDDKW